MFGSSYQILVFGRISVLHDDERVALESGSIYCSYL